MNKVKRITSIFVVLITLVAVASIGSWAEVESRAIACDCGGKTATVRYNYWPTASWDRVCTHGGSPYWKDIAATEYVAQQCERCSTRYITSTTQGIYCGYRDKFYNEKPY